MPLNAQRLLDHDFTPITQHYTPRDAILYALGLGLGSDPLDEDDLRYLIETRLSVLPSFAVTLASPGMWIRDPGFNVDFVKLVHAEQDATFHTPLPLETSVTAKPVVESLTDRGEGKGALLVVRRDIRDAGSDTLYATIRQTLLLRGDGGFGGPPPAPTAVHPLPDRAADHSISIPISSRAALIYRLSGDWNPLHSDPATARMAGFDRPILHGLASYGIAGYAVMRATGMTLSQLSMRFCGVVIPGQTMIVSVWHDGSNALFEAHVGERRVLDRGYATLRP